MPIPLGILAAAGFRPTAGGTYELIETITVSGSSTTSVTFNVGSYNTTYQHLQIRGLARCNNNSTLAGFITQLNGDSAGNYSAHTLEGVNGATPVSTASTNASSIAFYIPGGTSTGSSFAPFVTDILDPYETTKNKTTRTLVGFTAPGSWNIIQLVSGSWRNTNSVTSITLAPNQSTLAAGSRFSIYGLKAS